MVARANTHGKFSIKLKFIYYLFNYQNYENRSIFISKWH